MKKIILQPSGKEFPYEEGQSVLSVLEKHGLAMPNNCRAGACGECKVKVLKGDYDQGFVLDMALSQADRDDGFGLMCMAKLKSEVMELEWSADARPKLFPPRENMPFIVIEKSQATPNIVKLRLRPLGTPMRFWPGQYIQVYNPELNIPKRCYSIANIPNNEGEIILHITKVEAGKTSSWLHDNLKVGDKFKVDGAYGTFIGDPSAETPVLCLAAGSGLAPITSLASAALLRGGFRKPAHILFSGKTKDDVYENGLFSFMQAKFRNFKFKYTLTQEKNPDGLEGRIPTILPELYPDLSKHSVYIAGSTEFVEACVAKVKELGGVDEFIHTEGFTTQS